MNHLFEIKKKENETIHELNIRFDKIVSNIPQELRPTEQVVCILYLNAFDGWLGLNLKEKNLDDLKTAQTLAKKAVASVVSMGKMNLFDENHSIHWVVQCHTSHC